jgi:hypothetical protein
MAIVPGALYSVCMRQTTERRAKVRDPINLRVRFRTLGMNLEVTGNGETVDFSSHGIFVAAPHTQKLSLGSRLETIVEWPIRLHGQTSLELVTIGTVVRSTVDGFAVFFAKHKFRPLEA